MAAATAAAAAAAAVAVVMAVIAAIVVTVTAMAVVAMAEGMCSHRGGECDCRCLQASRHLAPFNFHQDLITNSFQRRSNGGGYGGGGGGGYGGGGYGGGGGGDRMSALGAGLQKQEWGKLLSSDVLLLLHF